ncbi:hypothetical protein DRQ12_13025 [candidate division KSB1 bacterium]|nr:MAG: hypothetical protein DRQ12_13025 [candidate division KSB1 bacterium]
MMTSEEFWKLIHKYDAAIFPMQFIFSIAAVVLVVFMVKKPSARLNRWINLFLVLCYLWIGVVFFLVHNKDLSIKMHYFQPILMFIIAFLFALDLFLKRTNFKFSNNHCHNSIMLFFMAYSIIGYPLIGWLLGHPYSVKIYGDFSIWVPIFGVYPCPTTIFSLSLLSLALPQGDKKVMIPLLFWGLFSIMGPPLRIYGVYEDIGLFFAGFYGLIAFVKSFRKRIDQ